MRNNGSLLMRLNRLEKSIPKPIEEHEYLIEVKPDEEGGPQTYMIVNGERREINSFSIDFKRFQDVDIAVTIVEDLERVSVC